MSSLLKSILILLIFDYPHCLKMNLNFIIFFPILWTEFWIIEKWTRSKANAANTSGNDDFSTGKWEHSKIRKLSTCSKERSTDTETSSKHRSANESSKSYQNPQRTRQTQQNTIPAKRNQTQNGQKPKVHQESEQSQAKWTQGKTTEIWVERQSGPEQKTNDRTVERESQNGSFSQVYSTIYFISRPGNANFYSGHLSDSFNWFRHICIIAA